MTRTRLGRYALDVVHAAMAVARGFRGERIGLRASALTYVTLFSLVPTVTVALRTPHDLATYPLARTHACTYSVVEPSMESLADALWGAIPFRGRLPGAIPGLYARGHGIQT